MKAVKTGVVLGAGGALGAAWMVGVLAGLAETEGFDARSADVLVGTSAGAVLTALLGCGLSAEELTARIDTPDEPQVHGTGPVNALDVHEAMYAIPRPVLLPGNAWLAARSATHFIDRPLMTLAAGLAPRGRGDLRPLEDMIEAANRSGNWPARPAAWLVAMDYDSAQRVVWGRDGDQPALQVAVVASCAAPGYFPPVQIGDRRYVDGGAVSMTNVDVLAGAGVDEVLVLAPMAGDPRRALGSPFARAFRAVRLHAARRLAGELRALRKAGTTVRVLTPSAADLEVMGINVMNPSRRREVLHQARETVLEQHGQGQPADRPPTTDARRRATS